MKKALVKRARSLINLLQKPVIQILLVIILGVLVYSNTFTVPFTWDDTRLILGNDRIKTLSNFFALSGTRYLAYLSLAVNYSLNSYNVTGYHIFNVTVHILNALLVYWLVTLIFKTLRYQNIKDPDTMTLGRSDTSLIASLSGLLFVSHPVYTQAVTYISQRSVLMAAFFYLLSIVLFMKARLLFLSSRAQRSQNADAKKPGHLFLYSLSVISAALAMKCKEISFALPLIIFLLDRYFFGKQWSFKKSIVYISPILLVLLVIIFIDTPQHEVFNPAGPVVFKIENNRVLSGLDAGKLSNITRHDYMLTEFRVIITYIRLFFLPFNLNLDYDYPVYHSFLNANSVLPFIFALAAVAFSVYIVIKAKKPGSRHSLLISFGLLFFFITISIESFIAVLNDLIFEYRLYLPSIGIIFLLTGIAGAAGADTRSRLYRFVLCVLVIFSTLTYMRNMVWQNPISLWQDAVKKSPGKARDYSNLGLAYADKGQYDKAILMYDRAITINPNLAETYNNLGSVYATKGRYDKAVAMYNFLIALSPSSGEAYNKRGVIYALKGRYNSAINDFKLAISMEPRLFEAYNNLGSAYGILGRHDKALAYFSNAISINSKFAASYTNRGFTYYKLNSISKAESDFQKACDMEDKNGCLRLQKIAAGEPLQ